MKINRAFKLAQLVGGLAMICLLGACSSEPANFEEMSIADLHDRMHRQELTSEQLVGWYLDRIARIDATMVSSSSVKPPCSVPGPERARIRVTSDPSLLPPEPWQPGAGKTNTCRQPLVLRFAAAASGAAARSGSSTCGEHLADELSVRRRSGGGKWCPGEDLNLQSPLGELAPQASASANSATWASSEGTGR